MTPKNEAAGSPAKHPPQPEGAQRNDSMQHVGIFKTGNADNFLHLDAPEPMPEWKSVKLDSQVSQLMESMNEPVIAHDSGVIIGFNLRVPKLLNCPAEQLLWRRLSKFVETVSLPTLSRWIQASDHYTILVNGVRSSGTRLLLRLEAVASVSYPGGRRVEIISLTEFPGAGLSAGSLESD